MHDHVHFEKARKMLANPQKSARITLSYGVLIIVSDALFRCARTVVNSGPCGGVMDIRLPAPRIQFQVPMALHAPTSQEELGEAFATDPIGASNDRQCLSNGFVVDRARCRGFTISGWVISSAAYRVLRWKPSP